MMKKAFSRVQTVSFMSVEIVRQGVLNHKSLTEMQLCNTPENKIFTAECGLYGKDCLILTLHNA